MIVFFIGLPMPYLAGEMHHTCVMCRTHFNHLDGETYSNCQACNYPPPPSSCIK